MFATDVVRTVHTWIQRTCTRKIISFRSFIKQSKKGRMGISPGISKQAMTSQQQRECPRKGRLVSVNKSDVLVCLVFPFYCLLQQRDYQTNHSLLDLSYEVQLHFVLQTIATSRASYNNQFVHNITVGYKEHKPHHTAFTKPSTSFLQVMMKTVVRTIKEHQKKFSFLTVVPRNLFPNPIHHNFPKTPQKEFCLT